MGGGSQVASLTDTVFSQLMAVSLMKKNIRKLATLERKIPSLTSGKGSQAVWQSFHLDVMDNLAFPFSPFMKDLFNSSPWAESNWWGSLPSFQVSIYQLKHLEKGP